VYSITVQSTGVSNSFNIIDQQPHRVKRKIVNQVLNERSMHIFEPTMVEQIDMFINLLCVASKSSEPVNMTDRLEYLACDIVSLLSFGQCMKLQTDPANRFLVTGMYFGNYYTNIRPQFYRLQEMRLDYLLHLTTKAMREEYKNY
jgi:cytochrome P450